LKPTLTLIDHSIHHGILHRNTAAAYKSRLTLAFNALA
jgi:ribosomal protein S20